MPTNKESRSVPSIRRHFVTFAVFGVLLVILGGMFSTSAARNGKRRALKTSAGLAVTMSRSDFAPNIAQADGSLWESVAETSIRPAGKRLLVPAKYRTVRLNQDALTQLLAKAPMEFTSAARENPPIITLPMPDGTLARFSFEESPIIERGLAEKYPDLKTYRAQGIDDPTATLRFDWLPTGFHAMVLAPSGTVLIDPYASGDRDNYMTYWKRDAANTAESFECHFIDDPELPRVSSVDVAAPNVSSGTQLRTYRLALASTNEYTVAVGGNTIAGALAAEVLIMNRVNGVYERDVAIHMNIIANNNLITYAGDNLSCGGACTGANDPYTNTNGSTMLGQNTTTLNSVIGTANYDIGHVFSTGGGGVATLNGPCGGNKARGVTGLPSPLGDAFAIDYVAHEMGHQWGANHTFNGTTSSCGGGNRSNGSAYEPGSGISIMAYAGICGAQNLAAHSIDTMHVKSLEVIVAYSQTGAGNGCAAPTATGNTAPSVSGPGNFTIPKGTPFSLTAAATDINGDSITYDWEEYDLDASGAGTTAVPNTDSDGSARAIFRPYDPVVSGTRTFPSLTYILNNANVPPATTGGFLTGELLPAISRAMNFQVVARDNRANGGGINTATSTVTVDGVSGPFAVTAPNTGVIVAAQTAFNVTWNVAGTTAAPVNAAEVKISLSTDGGNTFPTVLLAGTANDGAQTVFLPNLQTTTARIKVEGAGNIFFDISDTNFTITAPTASDSRISGRIVEPNGSPLAGVVINLSGTQSRKTITDANGNFSFENVESNGFYDVTPSLANYHFNPSNRSFSLAGDRTDAVFTASADGLVSANAIDTAEYFVRQQYLDFLGREPEAGGFNYWSEQVNSCNGDADCISTRRIDVSAAFFMSQEFRDTGSFVYRLYKAALGRQLRYSEFSADRSQVVGGPNIEASKTAFADAFLQRAEFTDKYQGQTTAELFVDALLQTMNDSAGVNLSSERAALISRYNEGTSMNASRALVVTQLVDNDSFASAVYNQSFVTMQYFGYLRRTPEVEGYNFWLNVLNGDSGNYRGMVCSFITSAEYQHRFSSVVSHSNAECGP
jgi:hypothetical protein